MMKTQINLVLFTSFAAFSSTSHGALVVQYHLDNATTAATLEAKDWADGVTPSLMGPSSSSITRAGGFLNYRGWSQTIDPAKYVGFVITADDGQQMNLTSFAFDTASTSSSFPATSFVWGMRVNNGSGYGEWVFDQTYGSADPDFTTMDMKTWDFMDFSTEGSVEFALFGTASDGLGRIEITKSGMTVDGTVTPAAVPEPSAALFGALGSLALLRRRRR